jgi:hypothetical protein
MDIVQKVNNYINIPSSQIFRSYVFLSLIFIMVVVNTCVKCLGAEDPDVEYAPGVLYGRRLLVHIPLRTVDLLVFLIRGVIS